VHRSGIPLIPFHLFGHSLLDNKYLPPDAACITLRCFPGQKPYVEYIHHGGQYNHPLSGADTDTGHEKVRESTE